MQSETRHLRASNDVLHENLCAICIKIAQLRNVSQVEIYYGAY